jgi:predicted Zn-dependent protease
LDNNLLHLLRCDFRKIKRMPRAQKFFSMILLALAAGCAQNPLTGRSQLMLVSESQAVSGSAAAYSQMMGQLDKKKQIESATPRVDKVREITERLIAQAVRFRPETASWNWDVQVINDPKTVNAFCMAGGKMAIYSGMWEKLNATDDEVAQVMGHEIGHALANHTQERMSVAMATSVGVQVAAIAVSSRSNSPAAGLALSGAALAAAVAIQLPNSRESESEADQIGIELAARAGYDPRAAVTLWEKMGKLEGGKAPPEFLSTHPAPQNRAAHLKELGTKVEPLYIAAKGAPHAAPHFLVTKEAANERTVTKSGEMTREQYAAKVAKEGDAMTFQSEPFQRFRTGKTLLECRAECSLAYTTRKGSWKALYDKQNWRDLAISVLQIGYLSDLSYFLLAESAHGLGMKDAAAVYYQRALEAGKEFGCGGAGFSCEGFDVQKQASAAVKK